MEREFAIILAGGRGTRLWPLSRENYPKQFVKFINGESLFQLTLKRLLKCFSNKNIIIVASGDYKFHIINQIESAKNISEKNKEILKNSLLLEPYPKSTAPAAMLAIKSLKTCTNTHKFFRGMRFEIFGLRL